MQSNDQMDEIRASFFVECEELLSALQDGLEAIENECSNEETINIIFRAVHSIKGGAGAFGLDDLVEFAHSFETALARLRAGTLGTSPSIVQLLFRCTDMLSDIIQCCQKQEMFPPDAKKALLSELKSKFGLHNCEGNSDTLMSKLQPTEQDVSIDLNELKNSSVDSYTICFTPHKEMFENGSEPFVFLHALRSLGVCAIECNTANIPKLEVLEPEVSLLKWKITLTSSSLESEIWSVFEFVNGFCDLTIVKNSFEDNVQFDLCEIEKTNSLKNTNVGTVTSELDKGQKSLETPQPAKSNSTKAAVRVDLERIERMINLVDELAITQSMLSQSLKTSGLSAQSEAITGMEDFQRLTREIQDSVMMIRARPAKSLFQRMSRIIREASAMVQKEVKFVTIGETCEIDTTVIEMLSDPLTHLVRNAIDHGLEDADTRLNAGKSIKGTITLSAAHRSGRVVIELTDDGAGINRERVKKIAMEKGLLQPDEILNETEVDNFLFHPGFSTAHTVSKISGRGVGMDIVRNAIHNLGGRISIKSVQGHGTSFSISLPLTLAVLDGMIVEVEGETYVLPLDAVSETIVLETQGISEIYPSKNIIKVKGKIIPVFDLGVLLGIRVAKPDYIDSIALILHTGDETMAALIVDDILGQHQVVIKGLDDCFCQASSIAAATILGDGKIALILEPDDLLLTARTQKSVQLA